MTPWGGGHPWSVDSAIFFFVAPTRKDTPNMPSLLSEAAAKLDAWTLTPLAQLSTMQVAYARYGGTTPTIQLHDRANLGIATTPWAPNVYRGTGGEHRVTIVVLGTLGVLTGFSKCVVGYPSPLRFGGGRPSSPRSRGSRKILMPLTGPPRKSRVSPPHSRDLGGPVPRSQKKITRHRCEISP